MKKIIISILILANFIVCKSSSEKSLIENVLLLFARKDRVTVSGSAVKGVIKKAEVNVFKLNSDGTCPTTGGLGQAFTDDNGNYSVQYNKGNGVVCLRITPASDGLTKMFDEKSSTDLPLLASSNFTLTNIFSEDKFSDAKRGNNIVSPFSAMIGTRMQTLAKSNSGASLQSLRTRASKEVVIRFGLNTGLNAVSKNNSKSINTKATISDADFPELDDIKVDLTNANDPKSAKQMLVLAAFSQIASQFKSGAKVSSEDINNVIATFSKDFEDGVFDGKSGNGEPITIGTGANQIVLPTNTLTTMILPAMVTFINEGGTLAVSGGGTSPARPPVTISVAAVTQTQFVDTAVISSPINISYANPIYKFSKNIAITPIVPTLDPTINNCSASPTLPAGLTISSKCTISETPTVNVFNQAYTILATNGSGGLATTQITISVENVNTLYVLNKPSAQIIVIDARSDGTLSQIATYPAVISGGTYSWILLWNTRHLIIGKDTHFRSYTRNVDGTLNFAVNNTSVGQNFRGYGNPSIHPNGGSLFAVTGDHDIGKLQIDTNGNFSNAQTLNIPNWDTITPIHPSGTYIVTNHQSNFGQSITQVNPTNGNLSGVIGGSNGFMGNGVTYYTDQAGCTYSLNGQYLYCTSNSSLITSAPNAGLKQMAVTSSTLVALSPFTVPVEFNTLGDGPKDVILHPSGNYLYVYGTTNIFAFSVNQVTGIVNPTPINTVPAPGGCPIGQYEDSRLAIHSSGTFLYAPCLSSGRISSYPINQSTGALSSPISSVIAPNGSQRMIFVTGN